MKSLMIPCAAMILFSAGCVTMPPEVPDKYLVEKTAEEGKALESLKADIIAKRQEIEARRVRLRGSEQKVQIEKGKLDILKKERALLDDRQKQYQLENDQAKMAEVSRQMADKDRELAAQDLKLAHANALLDLEKAQLSLAEGELGVHVADLNYQRAKIASAYLDRQQAGAADEKKTGEKYETKYARYLDRQRELLVGLKNDVEKAALKVKIAEEKMKR